MVYTSSRSVLLHRAASISAWVMLIAVGMLPLVWPGDTPWINDEPLLIARALELRSHPGDFLNVQGLRGTVGVSYGPTAVWIYSLLLNVSRNPVELVRLRAALFMSIILGALLWLSKSVPRLRPAAAIALIASPYVWLYSRQLWDNTFIVPLGALAFAAYVSFMRLPRPHKLWLAFVPLCLCALTHLMIMPLVLVLAAHAFFFNKAWLRAHARTVAAMALLALLMALPWLIHTVRDLLHAAPVIPSPWPAPTMRPPPDPRIHWWTVLFSPLLGGRLLSAQGFDYFLGKRWWAHPAWLPPFYFITWVAHLFCWIGLAVSALRVRDCLRSRLPKDLDFHLALIAVGIVSVNWVMQAAVWHFPHPHYFNGVWIAFAYLAWTTVTSPPGNALLRTSIRLFGAAWAVSMVIVLGCVMNQIHLNAGNRVIHFGPILASQVQAAKTLGRFHPDSPVRLEVDTYKMFPHALPVLRELIGASGNRNAERKNLVVRYRNPAAHDGWIVVEQDSMRAGTVQKVEREGKCGTQ